MSQSRHVLVTGASGGIGKALAIALAPGASRLTLLGRDPDRLSETAAACHAAGCTETAAISIDVTDSGAMVSAVCAADDREPVELVFANAGIGGRAVLATPSGESLTLAREIVDVNVLGVLNTVAPLLDRLVARRSGRIVLVSSMAARHGLAEAPVYSASKAAVSAYGHGLRRLLAPHGVGVTVVEPGYVTTAMSRSLPFVRPFELSAEAAADRILRGCLRDAAIVSFPWQLHWASRGLSLLPLGLVDRILAAASARTRTAP